MRPKTAIALLSELSQNRVDAAARILGEATQRAQAEAQKLAMLQDYQSDYQVLHQQQQAAGITVRALQNHHQFMTDLDRAVQQQAQLVLDAEQAQARASHAWQAEQKTLKAYETLQARQDQAQQQAQNRQHQRLNDELASRVWRHGQAMGSRR